ncbi:MAG: hypothetical protein V4629_03045 [Pseudomonadota bacterium]
MKYTTLDDFESSVLSHVPGCPLELIYLQLMKVMIDLCEKTNIWQEQMIPLTTYATVKLYPVEVPYRARLCFPENVKYKGKTLSKLNQSEFDAQYSDWRTKTAKEPTHFYMDEDNLIALYPIPTTNEVQSLTATLILKPDLKAREVPEFLLIQHLPTIEKGTIGELQKIPGKEWSSDAWQENKRKYFSDLTTAKIDAIRQGAGGGLRVKLRGLR